MMVLGDRDFLFSARWILHPLVKIPRIANKSLSSSTINTFKAEFSLTSTHTCFGI